MLFTEYADGSVDLSGEIDTGFYDNQWNWIPKDAALIPLENYLIKNKGKAVNISLTSDGGSYFTGQVFSALFINHGQVNLTIRGAVASAATLMLITAKTVKMYAGASVMIHRVQGGGRGTGEQLKRIGEFYEQLDRTVISSYVDAIGARGKLINNSVDETSKKIKKLYDAETWLTSQDALDLGFVDELVSSATGTFTFIPFNKADFSPKASVEEENSTFLAALETPTVDMLKDFKEFAASVRAHKTEKPPQKDKANPLEAVKNAANKAFDAIKLAFKDAFDFSEPSQQAAQSENILSQNNQNSEDETMSKEMLEAMQQTLAEIKQQNQIQNEALKAEIEALKKEKEDAKAKAEQEVINAKKEAEQQDAKAKAEQEVINQKQADLDKQNAEKADREKKAPSGTPPAAPKKGEKIVASVENLGILASAHPALYERMTKTKMPKSID